MKDCPLSNEGLVCTVEVPHSWHKTRVFANDQDRIGETVIWMDDVPEASPKRRSGPITDVEIVKTIAHLENRVDGNGVAIGCQQCHGRRVDIKGHRCEMCKGTGDPSILLARNSDPVTSKLAAHRVDLSLDERHERLGQWLSRNSPATYDEMAVAAVDMDICERLEQGRRIARTMREAHGLIVPYLGPDGNQMLATNVTSNCLALCWQSLNNLSNTKEQQHAGRE